jgi:signal peptidase I
MIIRRVSGPSMEPTLRDGDIIFAKKILKEKIKPSDVVVARYQNRDIIKRVLDIKDETISLIGDNPDFSNDSRNYGYISLKCVGWLVVAVIPKNTFNIKII